VQFDHASVSPMSTRVADAMNEVADDYAAGGPEALAR
jgi:hypothetical protein